MGKVKLSAEAAEDLKQIKLYITNDLENEQAAINTVARITKNLHILEQFPMSGAPLSSIVEIASDYRFLVCGNYTAFYRYEKDEVHVARILYGRRDFMRILLGTSNTENDMTSEYDFS